MACATPPPPLQCHSLANNKLNIYVIFNRCIFITWTNHGIRYWCVRQSLVTEKLHTHAPKCSPFTMTVFAVDSYIQSCHMITCDGIAATVNKFVRRFRCWHNKMQPRQIKSNCNYIAVDDDGSTASRPSRARHRIKCNEMQMNTKCCIKFLTQ